jgi:hypothetical protein
MKRKEAVYRGLEFIDVYFADTSATSPDYFQISEFPLRLTAGKNLFKLRGHPANLKVSGALNFEVLDYNGNPIYSEVIDYIDEDKSRVIAIYVYEDTSPGDCTITLLAEAATINNAPAPVEWQGRANVKWTRTVPVNPNVSNTSEIIFQSTPTVTVTEQIGVQLDRVYATTQFPTYSSGQVRYFLYNNQPAVELQGGAFTSDMATGTITIAAPTNPLPTPNFTISTTPYASSIKKILNPTVALLDTEYTALSSQSISIHTYNSFDYSTFSLSYESTPTYVETENSQSFAFIEIFGLEPATGDVSRIKVFTNNNGTVGTWEMINDIELDETEIFVPSTASLYPDKSVGIFTSQSIINTYWEGKSYDGVQTLAPATLTWTTASIENGMQISSASLSLDQQDQVLIAQIKSNYAGVFLESSSYKVSLDAIGTGQNAKLAVYLSGSSFYQNPTDFFNQTFSTKLGKRVGDLTVTGTTQRFDDQTFSFEADYTGKGVLLLVVESGTWTVSDIHVTSDNDAGYSPNYTRIKSYVTTTHKIDNQLDFKVEYYNVAGERSKQISYVRNKDWEGGNRYIDGNFSMLTGSLYVADSLNSGVAISGYPNSGFIRSLGYEGFDAGFAGFLLWSGSALPGQTSKGQLYSGVGLELYANTASYFRYSTAASEIDVRTDKFFFGNPSSSFISGSNGILSISSSNFILSPQGNVTASNADFRGTAIADIITDRSVSITMANSSSYINYYVLPTAQSASRLYLDGSLGGQQVRRVTFNCDLRHPIGKITTPGQKLEVILTNQFDYVTPPPGYTGPYDVSLYDLFTPSDPDLIPVSYEIKSIPAGDTVIITNTDLTSDAKLQTGGSITLFDHNFSSDVSAKTLTTSQSFYATMPIINSTRTLTTFTSSIYLVDTTSASVTLTLPSAPLAGTTITFKKIGGTNSLILNPNGTVPIDGALTKTTTDASASIQLLFQGTTYDYLILNAYGTWT